MLQLFTSPGSVLILSTNNLHLIFRKAQNSVRVEAKNRPVLTRDERLDNGVVNGTNKSVQGELKGSESC